MVIVALIPCMLFGMWNVGYQYHIAVGENATLIENFIFGFWKFLPLIIVSYVVGLAVEFAFAIYRGHSVNEGYLVTGLLIPLTMPIDVPLWMLAISVIFAVVIGKEVFGGTGMNILNPALTARAFLFLHIQYICLETKYGYIMQWLMVTQDLHFRRACVFIKLAKTIIQYI